MFNHSTDSEVISTCNIKSAVVDPRAQRERSAPSEGADSLGNTTRFVTPGEEGRVLTRSKRILRYLLQAVASDILPKERVTRCMKLVVPGKRGVDIFYSQKFERAHYGNLTVCGSVWACPVCAVKITERRRLEVAPAIDDWESSRGDLIAAAFTLQHNREDSLAATKNLLDQAFRRMQQGASWKMLKGRLGIAGYITASELTWGFANGWHPHKHALIFTYRRFGPGDLESVREEISGRFERYLSELGGYAHPDIGVKFDKAETVDQKKYPFKWGIDSELTKGPVKKARGDGLSPFQLLEWVGSSGEYQPVALFREYYQVSKGSHQLQYTSGLRKLLELNQQEKTDLELAQEREEEAVLLATIARAVWRVIVDRGQRGELLEVASTGDLVQVVDFLKSLGISELL